MTFKDKAKTTLAIGVAVQLVVATQWATKAEAQMIGTDAAIQAEIAGTSRASLMAELQRDDVRAELVRQGVDPVEAEARLAALSDGEVQRTLAQFEDGSAGAGAVGTLATIFLILLVTDLLCLTRLFNFTRCVR